MPQEATQNDVQLALETAVVLNSFQRCGTCSAPFETGRALYSGGDIRFCTSYCRRTGEKVIKENLRRLGISI